MFLLWRDKYKLNAIENSLNDVHIKKAMAGLMYIILRFQSFMVGFFKLKERFRNELLYVARD